MRAASFVLLAGLYSCSQGTAPKPETFPTGVRDLLAQHPASQLVTEARLVPVDLDQWAGHDAGGWRRDTERRRLDDLGFVRNLAETASLRLDSTGPRDRVLELEAWSTEPETSLQLTFNAVPLEVLALSEKKATYRVEVPAAFWRAGANQLDFHPGRPGSVFCLAEVRVDPAEGLTPSEDGLVFDSRTAGTWQLELAGPGLVDFELEADAPGLATIALHSFEPNSDSRVLLEERELTLPLGAPTTGRLLLPDPEGQVLEVEIAWTAEDGDAPLTLSSLKLFEERPLKRPSILFISIDTLSAANLSIYGYARQTTPRLAELVADSVIFEKARSNAPWTIPSYASQFTGLYARASKVPEVVQGANNVPWRVFHVDQQRWTLVEMLRAAGYGTAAFVDNLWLAKVPGFTQGFDSYDAEPALIGHADRDSGMRMVLPRAAAYLEQHAGQPSFVFAQIVDVHGPYLPVAPYKGTFSKTIDPERVTELPIVRTSPTVFGGIPDTIASGRFPKDALPASFGAEYFQADYDELVLELDDVLGDFFDDLKAKGLYDDLLIVFSADHGESMVDHDFNFRHGIVYDSAIHVPLVIKLPGQASAGFRVASPVQLVDLYPTLADTLGLMPSRPHLHGRSLLPALEAGALEDVPLLSQADILEQASLVLGRWKLVIGIPEETAVDTLLTHPLIQARLFEAMPDLFVRHLGGPPPVAAGQVIQRFAALKETAPMVHWSLVKYVRSSGPLVELFDLEADPKESRNLAAEQPEVVTHLLQLLKEERARAEAARTQESSSEVTVSDDMLEELRRLGYVGND